MKCTVSLPLHIGKHERNIPRDSFKAAPLNDCTKLQARQELAELVAKPSLAGIPLLVLGNKNDLPGALSTGELIDRLDLKARLSLLCLFWYPICKNFF